MAPNVAVIGAGVNGLSTAYALKLRDPQLKVTIFSDKFTPDVVSDVAGGFWQVVMAGDTPEELVRKWGKVSWDWSVDLLKREDSHKIGLSYCASYQLFDIDIPEIPFECKVFSDIRRLTDEELNRFPVVPKCGFSFTTMIIEGSKYMPWLLEKFKELGGVVLKKEVTSFDELASSYDVVVNCTGLGAKKLCGDDDLHPIRGHIVRHASSMSKDYEDKEYNELKIFMMRVAVKAPWIRHSYELIYSSQGEYCCYVIPKNGPAKFYTEVDCNWWRRTFGDSQESPG